MILLQCAEALNFPLTPADSASGSADRTEGQLEAMDYPPIANLPKRLSTRVLQLGLLVTMPVILAVPVSGCTADSGGTESPIERECEADYDRLNSQNELIENGQTRSQWIADCAELRS